MGLATVKNAADTWINQSSGNQDRNYNTKPRLHMRAAASNNRYAFLYFNKPWPSGANIISAKLRVYTYEAWTGSNTLTAQRASQKWSVNKMTYNRPATGGAAVTGATAATTISGPAANTMFEIDVTALCQAVASGAAWYGFRLSTNNAADVSIHSAQAPIGAFRPVLVVTWSEVPDEPDNLRPGGGRITSNGAPFLSWNFSDVNGDNNLANVQVQIGASQVLLDAGTATWDSGTIPSTEPNLDLSMFDNGLTDPGFEAGVVGWTATNVTLAQTAAQAHSGTKSMSMTSTSTSQPIATSVKFPIVPGMPGHASAWVRAATTVRSMQIRLIFYDAAGTQIGSGPINGVSSSTSAWSFMSTTAPAPAGATQFSVLINASVTVAADVQYVDDVDIAWGAGVSMVPTADGGNFWWRVRNMDNNGVWSPWADSVQVNVLSKGALTLGPMASIQEGSPVVTWSLATRTQAAYQVIIAKSTDPNNWLWDSGKITSPATSQQIPFGIIDPNYTYSILVRVWDDQAREGTPNDTPYVEGTYSALAVTYSGSVTNVTSTAFASDPVLPKGTLTFSRASAPDSFQLQQSDDGGTTWYYVEEKLPTEITTGGTGYSWPITTAKQYVSHQWRVLSVVAGVQSQSPTPVSGTIAKLCPVLMRIDGTDACFFMNPERDRQRLGIQGLHERMGGPPVLVTQRLGGQSGHVKGRFITGFPSTLTADQMKNAFLRLEADSGQTMKVVIANETLKAVAFNFEIDTLTDPGGITYSAEFDWIEV